MTRISSPKPGVFSIEVTRELVSALRRYGLRFAFTQKDRLSLGKEILFSKKTYVERPTAYLSGSNIFSLGAYSYIKSEFDVNSKIGRYCSIANDVHQFGASHPIGFVSTSPFFYDRKKDFFLRALTDEGILPRELDTSSIKRTPAIIEHDVWVAAEAMIGWNLTIGTGAIVAARGVVTKDVEPYSIVAGVPAKVVRKRFPDALIERLLASHWWDYSFTQFYDLPWNDPPRFLDEFERLRSEGGLVRLEEPRPFIDVLVELGFS